MNDDAFSHMMGAAKKMRTRKDPLSPIAAKIIERTAAEDAVKLDAMDIADEETTPVTECMARKNSLWDTENSQPQQKKRRRTASRRVDCVDKPENINYDRFRHFAVAVSLTGLKLDSFLNRVAKSTFNTQWETIDFDRCGISEMIAMQVHETYLAPCDDLQSTLVALKTQSSDANVPNVYSKFLLYMKMMMNAYNVTVVDGSRVATNLTCSIDGQQAKAASPVVVFSAKVYRSCNTSSNGMNDDDYARLVPLEDAPPIVFNVGQRYADILIGIWYLAHLTYIIENNCVAWVETLRRMTPADRRAAFPAFDSASDEELACMYVDSNRHGMESVLQTIIAYSSNSAKRNTEYRRKLKL